MVVEGCKELPPRESAGNPGEFLVSANELLHRSFLSPLKERDGPHEEAESVFREDRLPSVTLVGEFMSHFAHGCLVPLKLFKR